MQENLKDILIYLGQDFSQAHTILLDMDGCIVDDTAMFSSLSPSVKDTQSLIKALKIIGKKQNYVMPLILEAICKGMFAKAEETALSKVFTTTLIPYWLEQGIKVEILTSTMATNPYRKKLEDQKLTWLKNHGYGDLVCNFTEGSAKKQEYAKEGVLLIDDYDRTIGQFISNGGYGIQHTNLTSTLYQLHLIGLNPDYIDW